MREKPKGGRPRKIAPPNVVELSREYSITELAEMFHVSRSTVSRWRREAAQEERDEKVIS